MREGERANGNDGRREGEGGKEVREDERGGRVEKK